MNTTVSPAVLDDDAIRLICDGLLLLHRRSHDLAKLTGAYGHRLHVKDLAVTRALDRLAWHGDRYDAAGPCPVCGRTDRTRNAGFHRATRPREATPDA